MNISPFAAFFEGFKEKGKESFKVLFTVLTFTISDFSPVISILFSVDLMSSTSMPL